MKFAESISKESFELQLYDTFPQLKCIVSLFLICIIESKMVTFIFFALWKNLSTRRMNMCKGSSYDSARAQLGMHEFSLSFGLDRMALKTHHVPKIQLSRCNHNVAIFSGF